MNRSGWEVHALQMNSYGVTLEGLQPSAEIVGKVVEVPLERQAV
jgi:hypothetical protein